jgi:predicted regulator of Ras-like GTPase activity (Roadblock/LC7/MglB family)
MKKTLDDLCAMQGINGVFVCTSEGELIDFSAPRLYDAETLSIAASIAAQAAETVSVQHNDWEMLITNFRDGKLIFIRVDQNLLCVISDAGTNVPFLNVAIKVAKNKIKRKLDGTASTMGSTGSLADGKFSSQFVSTAGASGFSTAAPGIQQGMYSSTIQHMPAQQRGMGNSSFGGDSSTGFLWSGMGGASGMQSSAVAVADEASSKMLTKISAALAEVVGPMAKVFVKEIVQKICPTEPFSMTHVMKLIKELENEYITDEDERLQFRDKVHH